MLEKARYLCFGGYFVVAPIIAIGNVEVRKIDPPKLDGDYLGQRILCHRPMRRGSPNMCVERQEGKIIAHNYGHGGSGWTLAPGSAAYVNDLLLAATGDLNKNTPMTIIGAGALGLFTAYDLDQRGFENIRIVADKFENLISHNAGGLLAPVSMDNDQEMQKLVDQIGIVSYLFYKAIAKKEHPHFKAGARILPAYFENKMDSGLEPYVGKVMDTPKNVILDFGNGTKRRMVSYDDGIFIDTSKMMAELTEYLKGKGIKFVHKKIQSFCEIEEKLIINCSGFGAMELNNDNEIVPVQGHLIMLKNQNVKDLQCMILIYLNEGKTKSGQEMKRAFYIFPKHFPENGENDVRIIGGTLIEGGTYLIPNEEEFDIVVENAKKFYGLK